MAGGPIKISILADTKDLGKSMASAEAAMDKAGDTAKTAGSKIDSAFDSTAEHADTVASKGSQAAGALSGLGGLVGGQFGAAMTVGGTAMQGFADAGDLLNVVTESAIVKKIKDIAVTGAKKTADFAAATASKAMAAAQWLVNAAMEANPIGLVVIAITALVAGLVLAYKKSETFRNIVNGAFTMLKKVVTPVVDWFAKRIPQVWDAIKGATSAAWSAIKGFVTNPISSTRDLVAGIVDRIKSKVTGVWNAIKSATKTAFDGVKDRVVQPFQAVVNFVSGIPGKISALGGKFKSAGSSVINSLINGLKGAGGFVSGIAGNIWSAVKGMLNSAIDHINSALSFSINTHVPGVGSISINPPDIPHLARGGITSGPTMAMIGDNPGGREAVIPLDRYDLGGRGLEAKLDAVLAAIQNQTATQISNHAAAVKANAEAVREGGRTFAAGLTRTLAGANRGRLA